METMRGQDSNDFPKADGPFKELGASWIWPTRHGTEPNQYTEFRHEFKLKEALPDAKLFISADTNYAVWINGVFVDSGQYHDYPDDKTYDILDITALLQPGENILCALIHYQGTNSFQYLPGPPGLIYAIQAGGAVVISGYETMYRKSAAYLGGTTAKITPQLGFTFECHGAGDDNWRLADYGMGSEWTQIEPGDETSSLDRNVSRPRPLHKLQIGERIPVTVCAQGIFTRAQNDGRSVAALMQTDFLSPRNPGDVPGRKLPSETGIVISPSDLPLDGGAYIVIDLGKEEAGLFEMDLESSAGTVVDIAWGEHLDDLRVRSFVGGRNFGARYICREGPQSFTHYFTRLAGRYIQLHVSSIGQRFVLHYAGLKPTDYPVEVKGAFTSPDGLQTMIYATAVRTLHLCMHEHYEDCPWREQALYAMDARNQAISGYYCFGEYDFPAASFSLLGRGIKEDGFLEMCAPAKIEITIPSFSMAWVMELADHLMFSGDRVPARSAFSAVAKMMDACITNMLGDLLPCPTGRRYWHFYDWAPGLDGSSREGQGFHTLENVRFDAPLNLFFCLALDSAAMLADACDEPKLATEYRYVAERIRGVFHPKFWDDKVGAYQTYLGDEAWAHYAEATQSLAILAGACPPDVARKLRQRLAADDNGLVETTLSQSFYKFEALLQEPREYGKWVFGKIARDWGYMLRRGATSFWETIKGGDDFGNAGSLCHGWSGIPVYFYQAYLLGVRPLSPGFKTFAVNPVEGVIGSASGTVPTPYGSIKLSWEMVNGKMEYHLAHPDGTDPVITKP